MKNQPLQIDIIEGRMVISIGIETLAWASRPENGGPLEELKAAEGREEEWANDVAREMEREDEYGESPLYRFFDKAMVAACEQGSGAIISANSNFTTSACISKVG